MSRREAPVCERATKWLAGGFGGGVLAALTGQDYRALCAVAHLLDLWSIGDRAGAGRAIQAIAATTLAMQPHTRRLARELIAFVRDDRVVERVWKEIQRAQAALGAEISPTDTIEYGPTSDEAIACAEEIVECVADCFGMEPGAERTNAINYIGSMVERFADRAVHAHVEVEVIAGEDPAAAATPSRGGTKGDEG